MLDRLAAVFENGDATALAELLRADATLEMPPLATWFAGRETVTRFLTSLFSQAGRFRMVQSRQMGSQPSRPTSPSPLAPAAPTR